MKVEEFARLNHVRLTSLVRRFLSKHHVQEVSVLVRTSTAGESDSTWRELQPLRRALIDDGFSPETEPFLIVPI
jgi:hypothetical protein